MFTARQAGLSACTLAVLLLGLSLFGGRAVLSAPGTAKAAAQAGAAAATATPHVLDAWVRLPAVAGRPAGGYLTVHSIATAADTLVGVTSPAAARIELHSMGSESGVMKMRAEPGLALPAGGTLALAPGGNHLMIFGLADTRPGREIPLTLVFKSGAKVTALAETRSPADAAPTPAKNAPAHRH